MHAHISPIATRQKWPQYYILLVKETTSIILVLRLENIQRRGTSNPTPNTWPLHSRFTTKSFHKFLKGKKKRKREKCIAYALCEAPIWMLGESYFDMIVGENLRTHDLRITRDVWTPRSYSLDALWDLRSTNWAKKATFRICWIWKNIKIYIQKFLLVLRRKPWILACHHYNWLL